MRYYLIAGEASGDIYGSQLISEIQILDPNSKIRFWGGDLMKSKSNNLVKHYKDTSVMGFFEVLKHIFKILRNIDYCKNDIIEFKPDRIIYIDYPGFNLRICKWAKKKGFNNHYYISPQIWAWKENRINAIKRDVDRLHVILPFEKNYYKKKHGLEVNYSGHPLVNYIDEFKPDINAVSCTESTFERAIKLINKTKHKGIKNIFGGVFCTFAPDLVISYDEVDMLCVGEGENAMIDLANSISNGAVSYTHLTLPTKRIV